MKQLFTLLLLIFLCTNSFSQVVDEIFTSSGAFTVPDGVTSLTIEVVGAGGSGGINGAGGGGGGGYAIGVYEVVPFQSLSITVGIPGSGPVQGTTQVDNLIKASGGGNGTTVPNPNVGGGGIGGISSGGTIANYTGGKGGGGYFTYFGGGGGGAAGPLGDGGAGGNTIVWTGDCLTPGGDAGISGGAPGGNGGKGAGFTDVFCTETDSSKAGQPYGGGGGGGNGAGGPPSSGAGGYCRISYCLIDITVTVSGPTITANAGNASYQWMNCSNGTLIAGATNQSFTVVISGSYAVIISDSTCNDTTDCVDVFATTIPVAVMNDNQIVIYGNPFSSTINLSDAIRNQYYELFNSSGQTISKGKNPEQADFSFLTPGLYFLRLFDGAHILALKLIKQ